MTTEKLDKISDMNNEEFIQINNDLIMGGPPYPEKAQELLNDEIERRGLQSSKELLTYSDYLAAFD